MEKKLLALNDEINKHTVRPPGQCRAECTFDVDVHRKALV